MKNIFTLLIILLSISMFSQDNAWFYLRAKDTLILPEFKSIKNQLIYDGSDNKLKNIFNKYHLFVFKKTFKKASKKNLKKTFFVIADKEELMKDLLENASHLFVFGELINEEDKKIYEPNDYGLTSTIGENIGLQANLDYLDILEVPKAWYYTTGSPDIIIGISDGLVDTTNIDFKDKTKVFRKSSLSKGHGYSIAAIAAAQGDNGYGAPGICYDCGIYATRYGNFNNFDQLLELSNAGAKVISCSWVGIKYYENDQEVIDKMFNNGTLVVGAAGNRGKYNDDKIKAFYPASYNHVISASTVMYKHESVYDNILKNKDGDFYAENIRGYLGRTIGFKDNDTLKSHHIWKSSTTILNEEVDILTPSKDVLLYSKLILEDKIYYDLYQHSSGNPPFVSGTIGLMFSLYPCLPIDEVESIIKMTSTNIDNIKSNKPFEGTYGAGTLNIGRAVEMVYDLYSENETVIIEGQEFSRWDFKLTSLSKELIIQNQSFTDDVTLALTAKNKIIIGANTVLKPNINGSIILKIAPSLKKQCELQLREGFPNNKYYHPEGTK